MKRILPAAIAAFFLSAASTTVTLQPGDTVTIVSPMPMAHGGIMVDATSFPKPYAGKGTDLVSQGQKPSKSGDGSGDFRTVCLRSHFAFDDPIVYPGQPGKSHAHVFFGNTLTNANTTSDVLASTGNSTCRGGTINRTAYWAPAMVDGMKVVDPAGLIVYYKTGYLITDNSLFKAPPVGLRMIAGNSAATTEQTGGPASFKCNAGNGPAVYTMPNCAAGDQMWQLVSFPQCWDGKNLDSPDHKSHMAYPVQLQKAPFTWSCDSTHPVVLPQITVIVMYTVPVTGMQNWRLASDMYTGPAGYSLHSDWMMGWKPDIAQTWTTNCLNAGNDCQAHMLGDGRTMDEFDGN